MKLGELITALQDYRANVLGVDEDTVVQIHVSGAEGSVELDDVKVEITMSRGHNRHTQAIVVLEGEECDKA